MPRRGENIYKRKDGRWEGRYIKARMETGKAVYGYVYARSYDEAKEKLTQASRFNIFLPEKIHDGDIKVFHIIAKEWMKSMQPKIKESTFVKYRNLLDMYILPSLGNKKLDSLTHSFLDSYCTGLLKHGGIKQAGLSPKTVADVLSLLRNILRFAADIGQTPPCDARRIKIKQATHRMRVLTRKEQEKLCQYLYSDLNARNLGILICLFTGLRVGEICALRWEDISVNEQILHVCQTVQRIQVSDGSGKKTKIVVSTPKSSCSARTIPLPDGLVKIIKDFYPTSQGYFLTGSEKQILEPRTMQNHFKRVLEKSSVASANFHSLRHTFATRCIELGFDVKSLSEILGHANVNITMNRYVHPSMELKRENMQRFSSLIAVKPNTSPKTKGL